MMLTLALLSLAAAPPNVVLIMADDLGIGDVSCYHAGPDAHAPGAVRFPTPNIDALAARGLRFTDFHANGPVCSPTRAALMTGRYQQRTGIDGVIYADPAQNRHHGLAPAEVTLAERLGDAGYATAAIGKWHLGYDIAFNPTRNGFDRFVGYVSGNVCYQSHYDRMGIPDWWHDRRLVMEPGYTTDLITRHAVEFIRETADRPFFLYVAHQCPHDPIQDRDDPPARRAGHVGNVWVPKRVDIEGTYERMIRAMDEGVGTLVAAIDEAGLTDSTLILFCSDNGATPRGDSGRLRGHKGSLWEGGHRVPLIVAGPGVSVGTSETLALSIDLTATVADVAGASTTGMDGESLRSNGRWQTDASDRTAIWEYRGGWAVRRGPMKLIRPGRRGKPALFDLAVDPSETTDLAADSPTTVRELTAVYEQWRADVTQYATKQPARAAEASADD